MIRPQIPPARPAIESSQPSILRLYALTRSYASAHFFSLQICRPVLEGKRFDPRFPRVAQHVMNPDHADAAGSNSG